MLVSEGYPGAYKKGKTIFVPDRLEKMPCFPRWNLHVERKRSDQRGGARLLCHGGES